MADKCQDCGSIRGVVLCQGDLRLCRECDMKRKTKTLASSRDLRDAAVGTERTGTVERPMERAAEKDAAVTVNHPSNTVTKDVTIATAKICYPPIINECLCFVQAKVDILPRDDLVKVCCDFYSNDDIWHAKQMAKT